jgi:DNA-binding transcriptional LysR family regulator
MAMNLKLRQLETLRAVIECGSVTEAAERLRVSQPAVSKTLHQAEAQLGFELFVRERGRLLPTVEARTLLPEIIRATAAVEAVLQLAGNLHGERTGLLTLGAVPSLGNSLVTEAIARFRAGRPGVQVIVQLMLNHEVVSAVADNRVDLGAVLTPAEDMSTVARDLCAADLVCVMPADHPLAGREAVGPADLAPHSLISFSRHQPVGALIESAFQDAGLRRNVTIEVTQTWNACLLAQAGAGVAVVDGFGILGAAVPGLVVRPFRPAVRIVARLLSGRHRPPSRLAAAFIAQLDEVVALRAARGGIHRIPAAEQGAWQ